jgi:phosphohistidine swiveling domain-containing protein
VAETWTHDPSHYPEPMSPLSADVWFWAMGLGIQVAARELRAPFGGFDTMVADGGWAYERELEPDWEPDTAVLEAAALDVAGRWESELRARSHAVTEELRAMRPERAGPAAAVALLDRLLELVREQWHVHFLTVIPVHAAREVLHDAYVGLLGEGDPLEPYRLLEGLPNETLDADELLWSVSELARALDLADVVVELPGPAALDALRATHHGREVLGALDEYLRRYGSRSRLHELSEPRDAERPERALESVRLFLEHPRDLPAERVGRAAERDAVERAVLERISEPDRGEFGALLGRVTAAVELEETHAYHIDYPGLAATREALLGFGRRLVAEGRLDRVEDVFMLRRDELRDAVAPSWGAPLQELAARRAAERERARGRRPEPFLGEPPDPHAEVPPMVAKFYGVPGSGGADGDRITGTPASPGEATGIARVVRGPEDFARVAAGDVLVCATTTPAWTPLFPSLGALVTDTGGILCHAAVVAREYGLPAVVGAEVATTGVPDGALVRVDGATGEVRVLRS